jgi:ferredoxin
MKRPFKTRVKTLKIDGVDVGAREDETILELAQENGIFIPTLCHLEGVHDVGACRLCLVEVKGTSKLLPACMTYAEEGWRSSPTRSGLLTYRRQVLDLLFSERNHVCAVCVSNGHCELQWLAEKLGISHVGVPYLYPQLGGGRLPLLLRARPQPLHPLHALRARLRRDRRGAHLGRDGPRRRVPGHQRPEPAVGHGR